MLAKVNLEFLSLIVRSCRLIGFRVNAKIVINRIPILFQRITGSLITLLLFCRFRDERFLEHRILPENNLLLWIRSVIEADLSVNLLWRTSNHMKHLLIYHSLL